MATPEDFQLGWTRSGHPILEGKNNEDPRSLPFGEARKRLDQLLAERDPAAPLPTVTAPTFRPDMPKTPPARGTPVLAQAMRPLSTPPPPVSAPEPVQPGKITEGQKKAAGIAGALGERASFAGARLLPGSLPVSPFVPHVDKTPTVSEEEIERGLAQRDIEEAGEEKIEGQREDPTSREFQYYIFQKEPPPGWRPRAGDVTDLVTQGYLPRQYQSDLQYQWRAFRRRAKEKLRVPARYAALQAEERENMLPGESEVRDRFFKRGLSFREGGEHIDWYKSLETLRREWHYVLDRKRAESGKPRIMDASEEEIEEHQNRVLTRAQDTLSSIAAATGFSVSDASDPDRMARIKWWWAPLEPFRASLSPVTMYDPNTQSVAGDAAHALFALGEPRFVPISQEAYGNLGKFGRAASLIITPLTAMLESGEGWNHEDTLKRITSGHADPFDHLADWGSLFGGGKKLGVAVLTLGLLLEPEPFTSIFALPAAARKAATYAIKQRGLSSTATALEKALPSLSKEARTAAEFLEEVKKSEPAAANFLGIVTQQQIGMRGRASGALRRFDSQLREVEKELEDLQKIIMDLSGEGKTMADTAKLAEANKRRLVLEFEKAVYDEAVALSLRDATLKLRGVEVDDLGRVKDTPKTSADEALERVLARQAKKLETAVNKATPGAKKAKRAIEGQNERLGRKLQDLLGPEPPAMARTARGGVRKDWYPLFETPPGATAPRVPETLERVQWKDVVAVTEDGKWVKSERKGGVIGGPGAELRIMDISVGRANQSLKVSTDIKLPAKPRKNERFELWIDVTDSLGNSYRVRHPISRSSWGARADARELLASGFGIDAAKGEDLWNVLKIRRDLILKVDPDLQAYKEAVRARKANAVIREETLNATTSTRLIEAHRVARAKTAVAKQTLKASQKAAKSAGRAGEEAKRALSGALEKEAKANAEVAARKMAKGGLEREVKKTIAGVRGLQKLLKERVGGYTGAMFKRGLNDILNYKELRYEELQKMVEDVAVRSLEPVPLKLEKGVPDAPLDPGSAAVNSSKYKQSLLSAHLKAPGASEETAEAAMEILKRKSPEAKKVLDAAEKGEKVRFTGAEVARLQSDTKDFLKATWKDRLSTGPMSYGKAIEREKEYHVFFGPESWTKLGWYKNLVTKRALRQSRVPEVAARMAKLRVLGVTDDEIADTLIFSSNIYDVGLDELISITQNGALGPEAATRAIIRLMDNEGRLALRADRAGSVQYQQFERFLGADSRFSAARAALLEEFRIAPRREMTAAKLLEGQTRIARAFDIDPDLVTDPDVLDQKLVARLLDLDSRDEISVPLQGIAYAFYPGGVGSTDKARALEYAALKILRGTENAEGVFEGGAKTFQEYADRMMAETGRIIGAAPDDSIRAFSMAATAMTGAATNGYAKNLASKMSYATITPREALAVNRLLTGNPDIVVNPGKKGWQAAALTEEEIEAGISAMNRMGLPVKQLGLKLFQESEVIPRVKELVRISSEGDANPYMVRSLVNEIDKFSGGAVKRLAARTPKALPLEGLTGPLVGLANTYGQLSSIWRTSVTTGLILPNPGYWTNNIIGDLSQMWLQEGLGVAAKLSFNNFANNIPYWGRGLAERQYAMQAWAAAKGKDALPSPIETLLNPYLGKLLKGEDFTITTKNGIRIEARTLAREAIEDGIYSTQVNQELYDLYKSALRKDDAWEAFAKLGKNQNKAIADHANIVQQRQRMALYAHYRVDKGLSREAARSRTLEALYDWKDGVSAFELQTFVKLSPFYRFWRLGMRQIAGAFLDPVTKPVISEMKKSLIGQTKIARAKQQVLLFGGMPEIFGYENMEEGNRDAALYDAFYAHKFPEWMETRILTGFYGMPTDKGYRDWYLKQYNRDYDSIAHVAPTATILDTLGLTFNLLESTYAVSRAGKLPFAPDVTVPSNWPAKAVEPWLQQTNPAVQTLLRGIFSELGIPTEYVNKSGQVRLRMGEEEVILAADQVLGFVSLGLLGVPGLGDRDPETGAYKMNTWAYQAAQLFPGLLTQAPRWVKAIKNPGWNESYTEGAQWMLQSIFRVGAKTPYSGRREFGKSAKRFEEGFDKRPTKGHAVLDVSGRRPLK